MAFTWKQNVKSIMQAGNSPTAREIRSKDHVASGKTRITWTVKNSGAVILHRACLGSARPEQTPAELQECLCTHCITSDVHWAGLSLALCSDNLGKMTQKIWLCRTCSRCELTLYEALWGWLLFAFVDPEIHKDMCWLCTQPLLSSQAPRNTKPHSVSELSRSLEMCVRIYVFTCKPSRSQGVFLWLVLYFFAFWAQLVFNLVTALIDNWGFQHGQLP